MHDYFIVLWMLLLWMCFGVILLIYKKKPKPISLFNKAKPLPFRTFQRKPKWVKREVIRIKAHAEKSGCRAVADIFNRHHVATGFSVSKSYVATILRNHQSEILNLRKVWRRKTPRRMSKNRIWGVDLTGVMNSENTVTNIFGIIDHGTRKCISLKSLQNKASITLLKILIEAMERNGKPKAVRTDNESIFTSRLFRFGLWILGIQHQRTMLHCPWMNGRIERFFGTFKQVADQVIFNTKYIQKSLDEFAFWYNHVRPHRGLNGFTPHEMWSDIDPYAKPPKSSTMYVGWDGLLTGFHIDYG